MCLLSVLVEVDSVVFYYWRLWSLNLLAEYDVSPAVSRAEEYTKLNDSLASFLVLRSLEVADIRLVAYEYAESVVLYSAYPCTICSFSSENGCVVLRIQRSLYARDCEVADSVTVDYNVLECQLSGRRRHHCDVELCILDVNRIRFAELNVSPVGDCLGCRDEDFLAEAEFISVVGHATEHNCEFSSKLTVFYLAAHCYVSSIV